MTTRTRNAVALLSCAALLAAIIAIAVRSAPARLTVVSPLQAVPAQAAFVLSLDLDRLRASPFSALIADTSLGAPELSSGCSRRALESVRELAVWVPDDSASDFGLVATGDVDSERWMACARESIAARGGVPATSQIEGFAVTSDASQGREGAMVAVREGGPVLIANATLLHRMIATLLGRIPSALAEGDHARMRRDVGIKSDASATLLVSQGVRNKLRELAGGEVPIAQVGGLAIAATADEQAHVRLLAWCDGATACASLAQVAEERRAQIRGSMPLRIAGVSALLDGARVGTQGNVLVAETTVASKQVVEVLQRLWRWEDALGDREAVPPPPPRLVLPRPDELLRPLGPDGGSR